VANAAPEDFRARARAEADRYGPDPWVFVRELLQNARDAGARNVVFTCGAAHGQWRLHCRDDGEGMSYAHARSYLFALYASSKEQRRDQVGRFGVGFWSILRFEPQRIVIRSRPRVSQGTGPSGQADDGAWELELAGDLESAVRRTPRMEPGTEVLLERPGPDEELERRVFEAAWQNARFLSTRDQTDLPLKVTVNGKSVNARFALPAPSSAFRRGAVRGVVGLGSAARVELFSRGLRVRAAASLADFTAGGGRHTGRSRVQFAELPGRLAPQALLESDALELLLSRSDARENKALRKLVRLAERELARLIARQLDAVRPMAWWRRLLFHTRVRLRDSLALRTALAAGFGALVALVIAWSLWGDHVFARLRADLSFLSGGTGQVVVGTAGDMSPRYTDLGRLYRGPQVDVLSGSGVPVELTYEPAAAQHYFAALILERFDAAGQAAASDPQRLGPYVGADAAACAAPLGTGDAACVTVTLVVDSPAGPLRLPVPTGHRVDPGTLRLADQIPQLHATVADEPVLAVPAPTRGTLRYTTVPAAPPQRADKPRASGLLPAELRQAAAALRKQPVRERVSALQSLTRDLVVYSNAPEVAAQHQDPALADLHFIERTLQIGAGDCDMQNALLVALLQEAGVPARMAIGFVGQDGRTNSWLHAWAEYRDRDGPWQIADASASARPSAVAGRPTLPVPEDSSDTAGPAVATTAGDGPGPAAPGKAEATTSAAPAGEGPPDRRTAPALPPALDPEAPPPPTPPTAARVETRPPLDPAVRRWVGRLSLLSLVGALLAFAVVLARRTRRQVALEVGHDLSRLLQGALQQPEAFRSVPAVFQRPLVPTARGRALSLDDARALAGKGQLYRTRGSSDLARRAVAGGAHVLEDSVPEARAVADALGATDLDPWDRLLAGAGETPLLTAVNTALRGADERLHVIAADGLGEEVRSLDLQPLRLRGSPWHGRRVVAIAADNPWMRDAAAAMATRPHAAVFAALDYIADRLDLPAERRAQILHNAARAAIHEAAK
jgi:transglutaminase-like putative cysteine protease